MSQVPIKGSQINWNQVFYFCQIALRGSIKDAATQLGITSSTLSEHLSQLEKDLEVELFHRQHRRLVLTDQGMRLFQHAKQMFEVGQRIIDVVSPVPLGCYPISVGVVPCPATESAYEILESYLGKYGPLSINVIQTRHSEIEKELIEARFDFAFSDRGPERKDIVAQLVSSSFLQFYVSSKWVDKPFADLVEKLPLLALSSESGTRAIIDNLFEELELIPRAIVTSEYPHFLHRFCERGQGIGLFSESSVERLGVRIKPVKLPGQKLRIQDKLYVLWPKDGENSEAVKRLKEIIDAKFPSSK